MDAEALEAARKVAMEFVHKAYDSLEPADVWIDVLTQAIAAHTREALSEATDAAVKEKTELVEWLNKRCGWYQGELDRLSAQLSEREARLAAAEEMSKQQQKLIEELQYVAEQVRFERDRSVNYGQALDQSIDELIRERDALTRRLETVAKFEREHQQLVDEARRLHGENERLKAASEQARRALYMGTNVLGFWLDWAEDRGAVVHAGRDILVDMRTALTASSGGRDGL